MQTCDDLDVETSQNCSSTYCDEHTSASPASEGASAAVGFGSCVAGGAEPLSWGIRDNEYGAAAAAAANLPGSTPAPDPLCTPANGHSIGKTLYSVGERIGAATIVWHRAGWVGLQ